MAPRPLHVSALGTTFRVEADHAWVAARVRELWRPLLAPGPRVGGVPDEHRFRVVRSPAGWALHQGGALAGEASALDAVLPLLAARLNGVALDRCAHLAVHAGVLACGGAALALPGVSAAGKSTLTAACLAHGWEYVSDEALCVRADGQVLPYPRPLSLGPWARDVLGLDAAGVGEERLVGVDALGGRVPQQALRLREVVFVDRRAAGWPAQLVPQHRSQVLVGLLPLAFNHYRDPVARIRLLAEVAGAARAWRLEYGDAREAAALLTAMLRPTVAER